MRRKLLALSLSVLTIVLLLTGCKGNPLPDGMEEELLIHAGREIVTLLNQEDYEAVYDLFREDVKETITLQMIQEAMEGVTEKAGTYKKENSTLATGQTNEESGEFYGIAVILCGHTKKTVRYRIAFDTDYVLIGLSIEKR